jgi:hypothetical protein
VRCAQKGETGEATWKATVESVHSDIGYAPAQAMLSAYGFYDGHTRHDLGAPRQPGAPPRSLPPA